MDPEVKEKLLTQLGMGVLNILERDDEWTVDTLDKIVEAACDLRLAYIDDKDYLFKQVK